MTKKQQLIYLKAFAGAASGTSTSADIEGADIAMAAAAAVGVRHGLMAAESPADSIPAQEMLPRAANEIKALETLPGGGT